MIETGIVTRIETQVPTLAGNVHPVDRQNNALLPVLVYQRISTQRDYSHSSGNTLVQSRYQLNLYHTDYVVMLGLRDDVVAAFHGFTGDLGNGVMCKGATVTNDSEEFLKELSLYGGGIDLTIWHEG